MQPRRVSVSLMDTSTARCVGFSFDHDCHTDAVPSKAEYTFILRFTCVHPDWDNNEYLPLTPTFLLPLTVFQLHGAARRCQKLLADKMYAHMSSLLAFCEFNVIFLTIAHR